MDFNQHFEVKLAIHLIPCTTHTIARHPHVSDVQIQSRNTRSAQSTIECISDALLVVGRRIQLASTDPVLNTEEELITEFFFKTTARRAPPGVI